MSKPQLGIVEVSVIAGASFFAYGLLATLVGGAGPFFGPSWGDSFGPVTGLLTALALWQAIRSVDKQEEALLRTQEALELQRQALADTRAALELQRQEMALAREAAQGQQKAQELHAELLAVANALHIEELTAEQQDLVARLDKRTLREQGVDDKALRLHFHEGRSTFLDTLNVVAFTHLGATMSTETTQALMEQDAWPREWERPEAEAAAPSASAGDPCEPESQRRGEPPAPS